MRYDITIWIGLAIWYIMLTTATHNLIKNSAAISFQTLDLTLFLVQFGFYKYWVYKEDKLNEAI